MNQLGGHELIWGIYELLKNLTCKKGKRATYTGLYWTQVFIKWGICPLCSPGSFGHLKISIFQVE